MNPDFVKLSTQTPLLSLASSMEQILYCTTAPEWETHLISLSVAVKTRSQDVVRKKFTLDFYQELMISIYLNYSILTTILNKQFS